MISEIIEKWIKGILIDGITGNLSGLFDNVNAKVGEIASDVGSTPQAWNSGIFNMLRSLSETVVLPIAAAILALVMCHELIQMITEKNNMHDFDTSVFFRWIFKSAFAILIVSNTWNIVMGVFDATQSVVNQSSGVIIGETSIHFDRLIPGLEFQLESMTIGSLLSLWFQTLVVGLTMNILSICIFNTVVSTVKPSIIRINQICLFLIICHYSLDITGHFQNRYSFHHLINIFDCLIFVFIYMSKMTGLCCSLLCDLSKVHAINLSIQDLIIQLIQCPIN